MRPFPIRPLRAAALLGIVGLLAPATRADEFRLESASFPGPMLEEGLPNLVIEASGVEPIGDGRRFLVAHDRLPALHVVDAATGRLLGAAISSPRFPAPSAIGPKWEGMARDGDGNYYVVGAHTGKTDEERAAKSVLLRFRLKDQDGDTPTIDDASVVRWDIARSLVAALKGQGLDAPAVARRKIEGLAIRERPGSDGQVRRELAIGLREPGDKVRAFVADITANPSPDAELNLSPLFTFDAGLREGVQSQLTSLEYVPALGGFLAVTASEDSANVFHGNTLWFVADDETGRAVKVATFEVAMKAEGLAVLGIVKNPDRTAVKLLITYDNDPHATHIPSRFQTATLVRTSH
jgi:hypothetical protein